MHKIPHRELKGTVSESIERVDLVEQATQPVRSLSGGQQRRLAFACATLGEPSLLLLDEPTAGLDPSARLAIRELIHRQGQSSTVLISTHLLEDVAHLCPQLGIMRDGRIAYSGPYDAIAKRIHAQDGSIGSAFEQAYERIIHDAGEVIEP